MNNWLRYKGRIPFDFINYEWLQLYLVIGSKLQSTILWKDIHWKTNNLASSPFSVIPGLDRFTINKSASFIFLVNYRICSLFLLAAPELHTWITLGDKPVVINSSLCWIRGAFHLIFSRLCSLYFQILKMNTIQNVLMGIPVHCFKR